MNIKTLLLSDDKTIAANIKVLAKDYKDKTGRKMCTTCPSSIIFAILTLKNLYKMTAFKFKLSRHYKDKKGAKVTISNANVTNESAIAFLKTNPERIKLFSEFPSNWKKLVDGTATIETPEQEEARFAIEAEIKAAGEDSETKEPIKPSQPKKALVDMNRKELSEQPFKDIRAAFPNHTARSKESILDKIFNSEE